MDLAEFEALAQPLLRKSAAKEAEYGFALVEGHTVTAEEIRDVGEQVVEDIRARPGDEDPWHALHQVLRRWQQQIQASERALASFRLIESTPSLRARLHEKRAHWRQQVSDALRDRPNAGLDAFTADLLTNTATAALDTVSHEWLRYSGIADRTELLDRAFTLIRPAPAAR
jgi:hypothetical protein